MELITMSALTMCCYCTLQQMNRIAAASSSRVVTKRCSEAGFPRGVSVFMIPPGVEISDDELDNDDSYFVCWFGELTTRCAC